MRALIVATSVATKDVHEQVRTGRSHRIDYVELASRLGATYLDFESESRTSRLGKLEDKLGLDLQLAIRAARVASRTDCDLVFSMSERVAIPLTFLLRRRTKHVVLAHHLLSPMKIRLMKILGIARRWDRILVPTHADAEALPVTLGVKPDRIVVTYNTTDTRFYHPMIASAVEPPHVLSLGRAHRDYTSLLEAMRRLPHINCYISASSLWLTGADAQERVPPPLNVRMLPFVPTAVHPSRLAASSFVVVPLTPGTTHWSAGTNSIMQAQAMGKAVIATRNPGTGDYVRDGDTGILVAEGDAGALARAIDYLWLNPDVATSMGQRARAWAEATYSVDLWLDDIDRLFHSLLTADLPAIVA